MLLTYTLFLSLSLPGLPRQDYAFPDMTLHDCEHFGRAIHSAWDRPPGSPRAAAALGWTCTPSLSLSPDTTEIVE